MLRLKPKHRRRIPNGLAVLAAILLGASAVIGSAPGTPSAEPGNDGVLATSWPSDAPIGQSAPARDSGSQAAVKRSKRLKAHLFLLRR